MTDPRPSRVVVVATGGTIANTADGRVGVEAVLSELSSHPAGRQILEATAITVIDAFRTGGATFVPDDWRTIAAAVMNAAADPDVTGVVVTHGTVSVEETAYFLHLTVPTTKPIAIACAQRPFGSIGADGARNLLDAIRVATSPDAHGLGAVLVMDELIHSARDVAKGSRRGGGFSSGTIGTLGSVDTDRISVQRAPTRRHTDRSEFRELWASSRALPRVDIAATYAGADGVAIDAFIAAGARGVVVNGFAARGRPHPAQLPALDRALEAGLAVVLASRGGDGRIPVMPDDRFVTADGLSAQKARVLLLAALASGAAPESLQRIFGEY